MISISSSDLGNASNPLFRKFLLVENMPQKINFNNIIKEVNYFYQITDKSNDLTVKFFMLGKTCYKISQIREGINRR